MLNHTYDEGYVLHAQDDRLPWIRGSPILVSHYLPTYDKLWSEGFDGIYTIDQPINGKIQGTQTT